MQGLTIYRSSAGSGKTYTLVKEYLLIALQKPLQFRRILAITFTNKATAEMKYRIVTALMDLASGKESSLKNELSSLLPDINIAQRSKEVLRNIIHQYGYFSISTIDSFFNEIVKALAHELHLSLRFEIELDQQHILHEACDALLRNAGKEKVLTEWLIDFLNYKIDHDKGWNIRHQLIKIGNRIFDESAGSESYSFNEEHFKTVTAELKSIRTSFEKKMKQYSAEFFRLMTSAGYQAADLAYGNKGVYSYFKKIGQAESPKDYAVSAHAEKIYSDPSKWLTKERQKDGALAAFCSNSLQPVLEEVVNFVSENYILYNTACEALKTIYVRGILSRLNDEVRNYREQHNVITLSDANRIVRSSVTAADTPLIYEKTGSFYRNYLIDEFQDTSTVQWENIHPLISEALSSNHSALLVGDVKQSIYRWRGGNMELLHTSAENHFRPVAPVHPMILGVNYRSAAEIIRFNNLFFHEAAQVLQTFCNAELTLIREAYSETLLSQEAPSSSPSNGFVSIRPVSKTSAESDENWKERSLHLMLQTINDLLKDGFSYGDITILVRKNDHGNEAATFLYKNGINRIVSADSLLINRSSQVIFVINCLRLLTDPSSVLTRKEIIWFLYINSSQQQPLHELFYNHSELNDYETRINAFIDKHKSIPFPPVDELVSSVIGFFKLNHPPDAYVQRFQDLVYEYCGKNPSDIYGFLEWWDKEGSEKDVSVIMPEGNDAIRIITIHKSKGLQFPVVIMPFADWELKPKTGEIIWAKGTDSPPFNAFSEWPLEAGSNLENTLFAGQWFNAIENNYIDNLNLLYVAFTRAINRLYINLPKSDKKKTTGASDLILATLEKLQGDSDAAQFTFGTPGPRSNDRKSRPVDFFNPETIPLKEYPVTDWQNRMTVKTAKKYTSAEIEAGNMLHYAMSLINTEDDADTALYKTAELFSLSADARTGLSSDVRRMLALCREKQWFSGFYEVKNETEFATADGALLRADRVMTKGDKAIVIDYKTGDEKSEHKKQAMQYSNLLKACGFKEIECWIVYTSKNMLTEVDLNNATAG